MRTIIVAILGVTTVFLMLGCTSSSLSSEDVKVTLKYQNPEKRLHVFPSLGVMDGNPADASSMECYFLNATGLGVLPSVPPIDLSGLSPVCLGIGTVSNLVSLAGATTTGVSMKVRAGKSRNLSFFGLTGTGISGCGTTSFATALKQTPSMYLLGSTTTDLLGDTTLGIHDSYSSITAKDVVGNCVAEGAASGVGSGPVPGVVKIPALAYVGYTSAAGHVGACVGNAPNFSDCDGPNLNPTNNAMVDQRQFMAPGVEIGQTIFAIGGGFPNLTGIGTSSNLSVRVDFLFPVPANIADFTWARLNIDAHGDITQKGLVNGVCYGITPTTLNAVSGVVVNGGNQPGYKVIGYTANLSGGVVGYTSYIDSATNGPSSMIVADPISGNPLRPDALNLNITVTPPVGSPTPGRFMEFSVISKVAISAIDSLDCAYLSFPVVNLELH